MPFDLDTADTPDQQAAQPQSSVSTPATSTSPQQPAQTAPSQSPQDTQQPQTVMLSNAPTTSPEAQAASTDPAPHPLVQRASLIRATAEALAGGPRVQQTINADGTRTVARVPLSKGDIGMSIVLAALSGGLAGLSSPSGPNAAGRAAGAGFSAVMQQRQQAEQQAEQQRQTDFANQSKALAQKAGTYETNSRTILNVAQAQRLGEESIRDLIAINRASGVLDLDDVSAYENNGVPMTEGDLLAAIKAGTINATSHLGPVAGYTITKGSDGTPHIETTHLVIKDANTPTTITPEDWQRYADAGIPGYKQGTPIPDAGFTVPLRMKQNANEQLAARTLSSYRLDNLRTVLDGTPYVGKVPAKIDFSQPGVDKAWTAYTKYLSHDAENSEDPYAALKAMSAAKRNADGSMAANPDARFADTIAASLGGWPVIEAAHDAIIANRKTAADFAVIDSEAKAEAVLSAKPGRFSQDQVAAARGFVNLSQSLGVRKAVSEVRERAIAEGRDTEAMYRFGRNPITGESLSLTNAPDAMLVDTAGRVIPQSLISFYKPTAQERQTADTARQVIAISQGLQQQIAQNPAIIGPLAGRSKEGLAKLGIGNAQAQKMLDDVSLLQSATTKMHTGRFSNEILKKTGSLIGPQMNPNQFSGALSSIQEVAGRYAKEDQLVTVGDYKTMQGQAAQQATQPIQQATQPSGRQPQQPSTVQTPFGPRPFPAGAIAGRDSKGQIIGYKLPNGSVVRYQ